MIRINLLPHRAEKRQAKQIQFIALGVISVILGALVVGGVQAVISGEISYQQRRNQYLKDQTAILDKQIEEINSLRQQTQALLVRKNVVEDLQSRRSDVVHLLDQMLRILPEGVYLKSLVETGDAIHLTGSTQSNARISTLMRAIQDSPWLNSPALVEIHASGSGTKRSNEFTLNFKLTKPKAETSTPAGKPVAAKS